MRQIPLPLLPMDPFAPEYLVPHSGIAGALIALEQIRIARKNPETRQFLSVVFAGPTGSGKSHLREMWRRSLEQEIDHVTIVSLGEESRLLTAAEFVQTYEQVKRENGILLTELVTLDSYSEADLPHIDSRLKASLVLELALPRDEELPPLIKSLGERQQLNLDDSSVRLIVSRVSRDLKSLDKIVQAVREVAFAEQKRAGVKVVRAVVGQ